MFENIGSFFKKIMKNDTKELVSDTTATNTSKEAAKERLHLVLMQDRANVSADFLELMKQEIVDVIKKYIVIEEDTIDVRIINQENEDGTNGAPSLCANIPILNIRNDNKGQKFRDGAIVTKEATSEEKNEIASDNNANDNVEIVNDSLNDNVEIINETVESMENQEDKEKLDENQEDEADIVNEENENNNIETSNDNSTESIEIEENKDNTENIENIEDFDELEKIVDDAIEYKNDLENYDYDEDDEDDVTFDDLLKAAEEEEKMQKQAKKTSTKTSSKPKTKNNKSKNATKSKKINKK